MPSTILEILEATARAHADRPAMARKRNGWWETTTWRGYRDAVSSNRPRLSWRAASSRGRGS